jgi:hypothetical protein
MRVATPDLDLVVKIYQSENWKTISPVWAQHGYDWLDNRAEQINLAMWFPRRRHSDLLPSD